MLKIKSSSFTLLPCNYVASEYRNDYTSRIIGCNKQKITRGEVTPINSYYKFSMLLIICDLVKGVFGRNIVYKIKPKKLFFGASV